MRNKIMNANIARRRLHLKAAKRQILNRQRTYYSFNLSSSVV
jgi:hypothetical protein